MRLLARKYDGALWPFTSSAMFLNSWIVWCEHIFCRNKKKTEFYILDDSRLSKTSKSLGQVYLDLWVSGQGSGGGGIVLRWHWITLLLLLLVIPFLPHYLVTPHSNTPEPPSSRTTSSGETGCLLQAWARSQGARGGKRLSNWLTQS